MKAELVTFEHQENGVSLFVVPETDAERELLRGLWRHGRMEICNGVADQSSLGFCVAWKLRRAEETS